MTHGGRIASSGCDRRGEQRRPHVVLNMLTIKASTPEMFETCTRVGAAGERPDISGVIPDRFPSGAYEAAFAAARSGHAGKVIMTWGE